VNLCIRICRMNMHSFNKDSYAEFNP
jgi:hypothetical protein